MRHTVMDQQVLVLRDMHLLGPLQCAESNDPMQGLESSKSTLSVLHAWARAVQS